MLGRFAKSKYVQAHEGRRFGDACFKGFIPASDEAIVDRSRHEGRSCELASYITCTAMYEVSLAFSVARPWQE